MCCIGIQLYRYTALYADPLLHRRLPKGATPGYAGTRAVPIPYASYVYGARYLTVKRLDQLSVYNVVRMAAQTSLHTTHRSQRRWRAAAGPTNLNCLRPTRVEREANVQATSINARKPVATPCMHKEQPLLKLRETNGFPRERAGGREKEGETERQRDRETERALGRHLVKPLCCAPAPAPVAPG